MFWFNKYNEEKRKQEKINIMFLEREISILEGVLIKEYWYTRQDEKTSLGDIIWSWVVKWQNKIMRSFYWYVLYSLLEYTEKLQKEILLLQKYWCKKWK